MSIFVKGFMGSYFKEQTQAIHGLLWWRQSSLHLGWCAIENYGELGCFLWM
jgi:hypothetical protein